MALTDKLTAIADAIRGKTGKTAGMTLDEMPGEIAGIEAGGGSTDGVRRIQFTVTLEADSLYLPLDALTEIPEILTVDCYDDAMVNAETEYGAMVTPVTNHITYAIASILPLKLVNNNSGTRIRIHSIGYGEYQLSSNLRGSQFPFSNSDRHEGASVGWKQPTAITAEQWQQAFIADVALAGYALTTEGVLCLYNKNSNAQKFAAGIPYLVTALYDTIPSTADGYVALDRAANATNVTATVPEESE